MKITNTQPGPRGVNTVNGPVLVDPKQTVDVEVYEREKQHIDAAGWFVVEGSYKANPDASGAAVAGSVDTSEIDRLKAALAAKDDEIAKLKKGDDDAEVNTAAEALALFSTDGVHVNTAKSKALKFLGDTVPADADKATIVAKLEELAKA